MNPLAPTWNDITNKVDPKIIRLLELSKKFGHELLFTIKYNIPSLRLTSVFNFKNSCNHYNFVSEINGANSTCRGYLDFSEVQYHIHNRKNYTLIYKKWNNIPSDEINLINWMKKYGR